MLIDLINESENKGKNYIKKKKNDVAIRDIDTLDRCVDNMIALYIEFSALVKNMVDIKTISDSDVKIISNYVDSIINNVDELNIKSAMNDINGLNSILDGGLGTFKNEWTEYKISQTKANTQMIAALMHLVDDDDALDEISELKKKIEKDFSADKSARELLKKYSDKCKSLFKKLNMDAEVEEFVIRAAKNDNLKLSDLTPSIMKWLENENLMERFSISLNNGI